MLIYINTTGSHGDVNPFLAIGCELRDRGHEVVVFTHPFYTRDLADAGLRHVPIGAEIDHEAVLKNPRLMHPRKGGPYVMKLILGAASGALEIIRAQITEQRPDVFVAHHVCFGSRWIAREAGLPYASGMLAPLFWFSPNDPVPAPQKRPGRLHTNIARLAMIGLRPLLHLVGDRWINRLRKEVGFPTERGIFMRDSHGGDVNLGLWSPHFRAPTASDPPRTITCGFPWYDRAELDGLEPDLQSFLDDGEPPIVFALGTAAVYTPGDYYEIAAEACTRLGRRGLLLTGTPDRAPATLPDGVRAFGYAPFSLVLPRGCATVHHGGIGSTAQALRAGRPSVVVPHAHDQFNNGVRVVSLGAGAIVRRTRLTPPRLAEALRSVLESPAMQPRCDALRASLADEDGAGTAADAIEDLGQRKRVGFPVTA